MNLELNIVFNKENKVSVHFKDQRSAPLPFNFSLSDEDQSSSQRIGKKLFRAAFSDNHALHLFHQLKRKEKPNRLLIVSAEDPAILSLPWESLYDPKTTYLSHTFPIRRRLITGKTPPQLLAFNSKENHLPLLQPAGFFGRSRELWQIEKAFIQEGTRRFTISGRGGQGKTYLAIEAGQWLYRTRQFKKIYFIDYTSFFGVDAIGLVVKTLAKKLNKNLETAGAVTHLLQETPTLLILDNVEIIPPKSRQALLEIATVWSEIEGCRVLLTSGIANFEHPDYPINNDLVHQSLPLSGLAEEDALTYCRHLLTAVLPPQEPFPERDELLNLLKHIVFHPLSIHVLAQALKYYRPIELENDLQALQIKTPDNPLWIILMVLSKHFTAEIERTGFLYDWLGKILKRRWTKHIKLNAETRRFLPHLGMFQGGVFEPDLLDIVRFDRAQWKALRMFLETTGLITLEVLPRFKVAYIKFHPCLAPSLWACLSSKKQAKLLERYQYRYAQLAGYMFYEEGENTEQIHSLVRQDLPNLLHAVHSAIDARKLGVEKFADNIDFFLKVFELQRDSIALNQRVKEAGGKGSYQA